MKIKKKITLDNLAKVEPYAILIETNKYLSSYI